MGAHGEAQAAARGLIQDEPTALRETYRITGLLHDFDYEKYPTAEQHPFVGNKILAEQGWPEEIREAASRSQFVFLFWRSFRKLVA